MDYFADDENVKGMRETARKVGLVQVLIDIAASRHSMADEDVAKLRRALELLGVTEAEARRESRLG